MCFYKVPKSLDLVKSSETLERCVNLEDWPRCMTNAVELCVFIPYLYRQTRIKWEWRVEAAGKRKNQKKKEKIIRLNKRLIRLQR